MKTLLLIITLLITTTLQAQSEFSRLVRIDYGAGYIAVACHPDVEDSLDLEYSLWQTFSNDNSWFLTVEDTIDGGNHYSERYMIMAYPLMTDTTEDIIVNGYIDKVLNADSLVYPEDWILQLEDNVDAFYRKGTTGDWTMLDSIQTELENYPDFLGPLFDPATDTLNVYDNYVLCFQLKFVYQPVIDTTTTDTTANSILEYNSPKLTIQTHSEHFNILAPDDNYTLILYDMSGKVLFTDKFYGEAYRLDRLDLRSGIYILTLEGQDHTFTKKIYKL